MDRFLEAGNVATLLVLLYAVIGGVLVVLSALDATGDPALRLSFASYLSQMAIASAGLAIGRGLKSERRAGRR